MLLFEKIRMITASGARIRMEGIKIEAAWCDQSAVSPLNVVLSTMKVTRKNRSQIVIGEKNRRNLDF